MEKTQAVLSGTLLVSAGLGAQIALTDQYLWYAAPTHAIGLVIFTITDVALALAIWKTAWLASLVSILFGAIQAVAMLGDLLTYAPPGVPHQIFQTYLLDTPFFIPLLAVQPIILLIALGRTNLHYDITMIRGWLHTHLPQ